MNQCPDCQENARLVEKYPAVVERLEAAERTARLATRALRECQQIEPGNGSYVVALLAQIERLEQNILTLSKRKAG